MALASPFSRATSPLSSCEVKEPKTFVKSWCLATLVLAALLMGTSFAHTLEMPAKLRFAEEHWLQAQQNMYVAYARVGGVLEVAAILAAGLLAFFLRDWRPAMIAAIVGAVCLASAFFVVWLLVTSRVNARVAMWTPDTLPDEWPRWRKRWEVSHVVRFAFHLSGFTLLTLAMLISPLAED
jgi:MFS family permease